ncbi:DUF397 domain-containing protein [Streptomyces sp. NPDC050610]|uniref:DUF397 domain-containing protein n=1 Tax=Streptomyces sp. NPDC050610 TaxID=3157097 RepID=UPI00342A711D
MKKADLKYATWQKSSYSNGQSSCVEWSPTTAANAGAVPIRDSKDPNSPVLAVSPTAWSAFVAFAARSEV